MQQYRLWQANREVFLYPENYLLPEVRSNQSPFFSDLVNAMRQGNYDADSAESAFEDPCVALFRRRPRRRRTLQRGQRRRLRDASRLRAHARDAAPVVLSAAHEPGGRLLHVGCVAALKLDIGDNAAVPFIRD